MIRRPPRSTRTDTLFPSRRSSDLARAGFHPKRRFPMASLRTERVLSVNHWSDSLFSFKTTREPGFRFESGHFVMVGMELAGKPLMREFSIASPHSEDTLDFLNVEVGWAERRVGKEGGRQCRYWWT